MAILLRNPIVGAGFDTVKAPSSRISFDLLTKALD
jgi:hypothetical protein